MAAMPTTAEMPITKTTAEMPITREMTISTKAEMSIATIAEMPITRIIVQKDKEVRLAVNSGG